MEGGIIGKYGFVNAEVEYQDYSKGHMRIVSDNLYDKDVEEKINNEISANYTSALKVNLGIEVAAIEQFRLRAGIGFAQSPYVDQREFKNPTLDLVCGISGQTFFFGFRIQAMEVILRIPTLFYF